MTEYNNKSIKDFQSIMSENTEKYIKLKLAYYIKINFQKYEIVREEFIEEGIFVIISNNINKKIIGIVPTKTESIYGERFYYKNKYLHTFDETYEIKDFTNNKHHFIHEYFNPKKKEIPTDKPHIICDEQGGVIVYNFDMTMPSGFYNKIIPKEERTKKNLLNNYYIIYQSFYDCAKNADNDEYRKLTNEEAVIEFLVEL